MNDIGRIAFVPELGVFGTVVKQDSKGNVEEIQIANNISDRNAIKDLPISTIIVVIELSVVVIKSIWDLWPVIKQIIDLTKGK